MEKLLRIALVVLATASTAGLLVAGSWPFTVAAVLFGAGAVAETVLAHKSKLAEIAKLEADVATNRAELADLRTALDAVIARTQRLL